MLRPIYSIVLFVALFFVSCADVTQTVVIEYDEQTEITLVMDMSSMMEMSEMLSDSSEDKSTDQVEPLKTDELDPFLMMNHSKYIPEQLDTIMPLAQEKSLSRTDYSPEEIDLLENIKAVINVNKAENLYNLGFQLNYGSEEEKESTFNLFVKLMEDREKKDRPEGAEMEEDAIDDNTPASFKNLLDYSLDIKNGIIVVQEQIPPQDMMGDDEMNFEEMEPSELAMMEAFMPGGITTRFELPGKVFRVTGVEHTIINNNIVEVHVPFISILRDKIVPGYKIEFTPLEPITDPKVTEVWDPEPTIVTPSKKGNAAPSDAIILFNGINADAWQHDDGSPVKWEIGKKDMTVKPGTGQISTKENFGDCQLHLKWRSPVEKDRHGQDKGNSGVYLQGKYEVQILNSYQNRTYANGQAASIYKQYPPLVNAMRPPGEWNTYDIIFHAPKFDSDGIKIKSGSLTVIHNGILVQNHAEILGTTEYIGRPKTIAHGDGPIILQDHSNKVSFRNIWLRKL